MSNIAPSDLDDIAAGLTDHWETRERLREHVAVLTRDIGERSVVRPESLKRAGEYVRDVFRGIGLPVQREGYNCGGMEAVNWIARLEGRETEKHYLLGAHYDSVPGCVGADDNASAVAVLMETAACLGRLRRQPHSVSLVAFALEEPPYFGTPSMGSRVHAEGIRERGERLDGMLCLEMVGYTCDEPGCQGYPPLVKPLLGSRARDVGDFLAVVGCTGSGGLRRKVERAFRVAEEPPVLGLDIPFRGLMAPQVRQSDHSPFWDLGYRAVMITDTAYYRNPHYHRPTDTMDTLDFDFMARVVEGLARFFLGSAARSEG